MPFVEAESEGNCQHKKLQAEMTIKEITESLRAQGVTHVPYITLPLSNVEQEALLCIQVF